MEIIGYLLYAGLVAWTAGCFILAWRWSPDDQRRAVHALSSRRVARVVTGQR